jgi:hypothetical protein
MILYFKHFQISEFTFLKISYITRTNIVDSLHLQKSNIFIDSCVCVCVCQMFLKLNRRFLLYSGHYVYLLQFSHIRAHKPYPVSFSSGHSVCVYPNQWLPIQSRDHSVWQIQHQWKLHWGRVHTICMQPPAYMKHVWFCGYDITV